jgi:hypothetical protein
MDKSVFLTVSNMKTCMTVFEKYMIDKYGFDVNLEGKSTNMKKLMYDIMNDVDKEYSKVDTIGLKEMNNITLNVARDYYVQRYKIDPERTPVQQSFQRPPQLVQSSKPQFENLERERTTYGTRALIEEQIKPEGNIKKSVDNEYEQVMNMRRMESEKQMPDINNINKPIQDIAYDPNDFMAKVSELEKSREISVTDLAVNSEARFKQDTDFVQNNQNDPSALYRIMNNENSTALKELDNNDIIPSVRPKAESLIPQPTLLSIIEKFISINGFDRDWEMHPNRFNILSEDFQNRYKNIKWIMASRVIIPLEIEETVTLTNIPKTNYQYGFKFSYPYILLNIDEFNDVYDGTNSTVQKSFATLVFDKHYKSPNGRGYLILKPVQKERKIFHPTPLASLPRMRLSLSKPNGTLFNESKDKYKVFKIEHEGYNKQYLKIVTNKYFDKNEFFIGDTIKIKGWVLTKENSSMDEYLMRQLSEFINRNEGHEILVMGQANESGFYRNFFVQGPGQVDDEEGKFIVNEDLITTLITYNDAKAPWLDTTITNGSILNSSLQVVVTLKLGVVVGDPGVVDITY